MAVAGQISFPKCPICNHDAKIELEYNFYFCNDCEVAIREKEDIPSRVSESLQLSREIITYSWVRSRYCVNEIKEYLKSGKIMDIGCGSGELVHLLSEKGYKAIGVDTNLHMVLFCLEDRRGRFYKADINAVKENDFDAITYIHTLEHISDPIRELSDARARMKTGGYLIIEVPNLDWSVTALSSADHRLGFTAKALRLLLEYTGFRIVRTQTKTYTMNLAYKYFLAHVPNSCRPSQNSYGNELGESGRQKLLVSVYYSILNSAFSQFVLSIPCKVEDSGKRGANLFVVAQK